VLYRQPLHMTGPAPAIEVLAHTLKVSHNQKRKQAFKARIYIANQEGTQISRMDAQWADNIAPNSQATGYKDKPMDYGGSSPSQNVDDLCDNNYSSSRNRD
jgi:hypothetical protein